MRWRNIRRPRNSSAIASRSEHPQRGGAESDLVRGLLQVFAAHSLPEPEHLSDQERHKLGQFISQWRAELGHADWLEWLADDAVHTMLMQWRELGEMRAWLGELPGQVQALREVAHERQRRGQLAQVMLIDDGLLARRESLLAELARIEQDSRRWLQKLPPPH